jgi:hypothetical protein
VYGKKPSVRKLKGHYRVRVTSSICAEDLLKDGIFTSLGWKVPDWIMNDMETSKQWLKGFYDAEAYVGNDRICLQCVNLEGLKQVKDMLSKFDVEAREYIYHRKNPQHNINYHLVILKRGSRYNFLRRIGLNHTKKLRKLQSQDDGTR